ncbi:transposon Ty3-I Gag-Pol polyprotein [Trichonephila clavipes]|nr:transposon Ty3-I Gag-Pol polyprotein [Trichonephila clavipes]
MYKNALKEDLIRVVEDLDGTVESTDTIAKLKTKIEKSSTFESDADFVKTLIKNCIDERVSRNEREATLEKQKIELAKQQLAHRGSVQISRISLEETKFHYLVSQLEPKYVENIWDIVNSKSDTKYTDSKNRLLSLFKESENLRIKRLLTGIELGDMKPSQLLQKLKTVATSDISDNLIKTLWLEKLPESIKNILVVSDENLSKLAVMADKISDMTPRTEILQLENL